MEDTTSPTDSDTDSDQPSSSGDEEDSLPIAREELSQMPLGDVMKLREKIGLKKFSMLYHGTTPHRKEASKRSQETYKRANKNRPSEISSKIKPSKRGVVPVAEKKPRDPRFEAASISAPEEGAYSFLGDMHQTDQKKFKKALRREEDPDKIKAIKRELNRMASQEQTALARQKSKGKKDKMKSEALKNLREGKRAHFQKKSEGRLEDFKEKFLELKKEGKLKSYMQRKSKKLK